MRICGPPSWPVRCRRRSRRKVNRWSQICASLASRSSWMPHTKSGTVHLQRLLARSGTAELSGSGTLTTASPNNFSAQGALKRFNPAQFGDFPAAVVNGTFSARGQLRPQWLATIAYAIDRSTFRRQPLSGQGRLTLAPDHIQDSDAQLTLGRNRLSVQGALGRPGDQLAFDLDGRELAAFGLPVSGAIAGFRHGRGNVRTSGPDLQARGPHPCSAGGLQLSSVSMPADRLLAGSTLPTTRPRTPPIEFHADATGLGAQGAETRYRQRLGHGFSEPAHHRPSRPRRPTSSSLLVWMEDGNSKPESGAATSAAWRIMANQTSR